MFRRQPSAADWAAFTDRCKHTRLFEDHTHTPCGRYWFKSILLGDLKAPDILFPNLITARIGIQNITALKSPSVTELSLLLAPDILLQDRPEMARIMRLVTENLPNVENLSIIGGERVHRYVSDITRLCHCFKRIKRLTLCPSALTSALLQSIATIPTLEVINVTEHDLVYGRVKLKESDAAIHSLPLRLSRDAFVRLRKIDLTVVAPPHLQRLLAHRNFPTRTLTSLWARFSTGPAYSPEEISTLFRSVVAHCKSLQHLTLRFGPSGFTGLRNVKTIQALHFHHIDLFLSLPNLSEFALDHTLPLSMDENDIHKLALHCSRYRILWLNPFPAFLFRVDEWHALPLHILHDLAVHCPLLEQLGVLVDATAPIDIADVSGKFRKLHTLFVGWSTIQLLADNTKHRRMHNWENVSLFLASILLPSTTISTFPYQSVVEDPMFALSSSYMRPASICFESDRGRIHHTVQAWRAVRGMVHWLQSRTHSVQA